jgi:hypothetical protein
MRPGVHATCLAAAAPLLATALWPSIGLAAESAVELRVADSTLRVELDREAFRDTAALIAWVRRSAEIVASYYDQFPARRARVRILAESGDGVHGGTTFANPDAYIRVRVGREVTEPQLQSDWVLVHEMTHLALPDVGEEHAWLSEGLATYVEGVARVRAGNRSEADVWAEELRQMPRGLPGAGDRGLDHTHTWGRTYWGGAIFCLLADVDIREQTQLRLGLQDALRAVLRASGGLAAEWPIERVLRTADRAVGTKTLEGLYAELKDAPVTLDLPMLWQRLGVLPDRSGVRLDDEAPLANVRRAIMHGSEATPGGGGARSSR